MKKKKRKEKGRFVTGMGCEIKGFGCASFYSNLGLRFGWPCIGIACVVTFYCVRMFGDS